MSSLLACEALRHEFHSLENDTCNEQPRENRSCQNKSRQNYGVRTPNLSPVSLTCVTTGKPKEYSTPELAITLRSISEHLFWGFVEKQTRYSKYRIAEPEKALLDWVYFTLQSGLTPRLDEIELKSFREQLGTR